MTRTRNMSDLLDSSGDVKSGALDNVPASNDASALTTGTLPAARLPATIDGRDVSADGTKLDGIEASATADQTDSEIKTAYENNSDTNAFTDALQTKLNGIEASATADQTAAEIRTLVENATDSNVFTDADHTKLNAIEASADVTDTANVSSAGALMRTGGTMTGNLDVADNVKINFGSAPDLQLFHDGSNSYLQDNGTGQLLITTQGAYIALQKNLTETMAQFIPDGSVDLYHDNSKKFATTSTGIDVTGDVLTDTLTLDNSSNDWQFSVSGNNLIISYGGTNKAKLDSSGNLTVVGDITAFGSI